MADNKDSICDEWSDQISVHPNRHTEQPWDPEGTSEKVSFKVRSPHLRSSFEPVSTSGGEVGKSAEMDEELFEMLVNPHFALF